MGREGKSICSELRGEKKNSSGFDITRNNNNLPPKSHFLQKKTPL